MSEQERAANGNIPRDFETDAAIKALQYAIELNRLAESLPDIWRA